jgi:signal transduction histidine kinase
MFKKTYLHMEPLFGMLRMLCLAFSFATPLCFASSFPLQNNGKISSLKSYWEVLEDPSGKLTIDTILNTENVNRFTPLKGNLSVAYTHSAYWLRASVQRKDANVPTEWWIEMSPNMLDDIRLFQIKESKVISTHQAGDHVLYPQLEMHHRLPTFRLLFEDTAPQYLYVRIVTTSSLHFSAKIATPQAYSETSNLQSNFIGIFYGLMLAMILYNLILSFSYRDRAIFYYILLSLNTLVVAMNGNGHITQFFQPSNYWIVETITSAAISVLILFYSLFIMHFLRLPTEMPRIARVFRGFQVFAGCAIILVLLGYNQYIAAYVQIVVFVQMLVVFPIAYHVGKSGYRPGWIVLAATMAWLAGSSLSIFRNLGLMESNWLTEFGFQIGSAIEIIFFAVAQVDRINLIKNENAHVQNELLLVAHKVERELEEKVQQRTIELGNAVTRLQQLDQEKNDFLGIAAHDLKNPLTSIIGMSDLLRKLEQQITPEQRYSYLERISRSGVRMMKIISDLLDINALETGSNKLLKQPINLNDLVLQVLTQYDESMRAKDISCSINLQGDKLVTIMADPNACFQVIDNLISNAIKYSPLEKHISILIAISGDFAELHVQDQGPGLSVDDQRRLFEKFTKLSSRPTAGEHSSGLGLSIVKKLSVLMGGDVKCESQLGNGCRFILLLPLAH